MVKTEITGKPILQLKGTFYGKYMLESQPSSLQFSSLPNSLNLDDADLFSEREAANYAKSPASKNLKENIKIRCYTGGVKISKLSMLNAGFSGYYSFNSIKKFMVFADNPLVIVLCIVDLQQKCIERFFLVLRLKNDAEVNKLCDIIDSRKPPDIPFEEECYPRENLGSTSELDGSLSRHSVTEEGMSDHYDHFDTPLDEISPTIRVPAERNSAPFVVETQRSSASVMDDKNQSTPTIVVETQRTVTPPVTIENSDYIAATVVVEKQKSAPQTFADRPNIRQIIVEIEDARDYNKTNKYYDGEEWEESTTYLCDDPVRGLQVVEDGPIYMYSANQIRPKDNSIFICELDESTASYNRPDTNREHRKRFQRYHRDRPSTHADQVEEYIASEICAQEYVNEVQIEDQEAHAKAYEELQAEMEAIGEEPKASPTQAVEVREEFIVVQKKPEQTHNHYPTEGTTIVVSSTTLQPIENNKVDTYEMGVSHGTASEDQFPINEIGRNKRYSDSDSRPRLSNVGLKGDRNKYAHSQVMV